MASDDLTPSQLSSIEEIENLRQQLAQARERVEHLEMVREQQRKWVADAKEKQEHAEAEWGKFNDEYFKLHQQNKKTEQQNAAMRALLKMFALPTTPHWTHGDGSERCGYCGGYYFVSKDDDVPPSAEHEPSCPIVKVRAFLAEHHKE